MDKSSFVRYFSGAVYKALNAFEGDICEIRLRAGKPLAVTVADKTVLLTASGMPAASKGMALTVSAEEVQRTFEAICRFSVHTFQGNISRGFVTVAGGHRAGLSGTAVYSPQGHVDNIRHISSINFRVANEIIGAADTIAPKVLGDPPESVLICGEPCSGKTTILRDLCRQAGDRFPVSLIDEREEIAASAAGIPAHQVGLYTDVFSGFSKTDGIMTAVRVMSPVMIFCDEIGGDDDINAIEFASRCGVRTAAAIHCGDLHSLAARPAVYRLLTSGVFTYAVLVRNRKITEIIRGPAG